MRIKAVPPPAFPRRYFGPTSNKDEARLTKSFVLTPRGDYSGCVGNGIFGKGIFGV